jgi:hypothetical protein
MRQLLRSGHWRLYRVKNMLAMYIKYHTPTTPVTSTSISPVKMSIGRKSLTNLRSEMIFLRLTITLPMRFNQNKTHVWVGLCHLCHRMPCKVPSQGTIIRIVHFVLYTCTYKGTCPSNLFITLVFSWAICGYRHF